MENAMATPDKKRPLQPHPSPEPTHPGFIMAEVIEHLGLGKAEMARRLGVTRATLYAAIQERSAVTADMALRFERVTGTSAGLLVRLQGDYDLWHARQALPESA